MVAPVTSPMRARRTPDMPEIQGGQRSGSFSYGQGLATARLDNGQGAHFKG